MRGATETRHATRERPVSFANLLLAATIAAVGNALFVIGQRYGAGIDHRLTLTTLGASVAVLLSAAIAPLFGAPGYAAALRRSWPAIGLSGIGLFLTYVGFNVMYARYGASRYVVYAVLSVLSTTLVVGGLDRDALREVCSPAIPSRRSRRAVSTRRRRRQRIARASPARRPADEHPVLDERQDVPERRVR